MAQDAFQSDFCADRLKALGDPLRLRIVDLLLHGEMTVSDIAEFLETSLVTTSHHLQILKHAELVEARREGRFMYYRLRDSILKAVKGGARSSLDLGCCRIDVPSTGSR